MTGVRESLVVLLSSMGVRSAISPALERIRHPCTCLSLRPGRAAAAPREQQATAQAKNHDPAKKRARIFREGNFICEQTDAWEV